MANSSHPNVTRIALTVIPRVFKSNLYHVYRRHHYCLFIFLYDFAFNNRFGLDILNRTVCFLQLEYARVVDANDEGEDPTALISGAKEL